MQKKNNLSQIIQKKSSSQSVIKPTKKKIQNLKNELIQYMDSNGYLSYSTKKKNFVIVNEHFVYNEDEESAYSFKNIANTDHRVYLFGNELPSPGQLMVYFPEKSKVVWSSLWLNLLGTILFAGIILSSFAYTIVVIFRQKKLGEMKNDFINNMTHEFKTPIATISLAADS